MEAVHTYETLVNFNVTTLRYISEDSKFHTGRRENLKSHKNSIIVAPPLDGPRAQFRIVTIPCSYRAAVFHSGHYTVFKRHNKTMRCQNVVNRRGDIQIIYLRVFGEQIFPSNGNVILLGNEKSNWLTMFCFHGYCINRCEFLRLYMIQCKRKRPLTVLLMLVTSFRRDTSASSLTPLYTVQVT
jgi:hypothetical protein